MVRICSKSVGLVLPCLADGFVGSEPFEGLEPAAEIVGGAEVAEVLPELVVAVVMVALDGSFLDRPVHPFHLAVGPWWTCLGKVESFLEVKGELDDQAATVHEGV